MSSQRHSFITFHIEFSHEPSIICTVGYFSFVLCCYQFLISLTICSIKFVTLLWISGLLQKSTLNQQFLVRTFRLDPSQHRSGVVVFHLLCCIS